MEYPDRTSSLARRLQFACTALAVCWISGVLLLGNDRNPYALFDAGTYLRAGRAWLAGARLYADPNFRQWPVVALLCAPFALLPEWLALRAWAVLNGAAAALGFGFLIARLRADGVRVPTAWQQGIVLGPPLLFVVFLGQMSGLCFAAWAAGLAALPRRPWLAGACFGLMALKPQLALIALPALVAAPAAAWLAAGAVGLLWPLASVLLLGPASLLAWFDQLRATAGAGAARTVVALPLATALPLSPRGFAIATAAGGLVLVGLLAALAAQRLRRGGRPIAPAAVDAAAALALAFLPYALFYDLLFAAPAALRLAGRSAPPAARWAVFVCWWAIPLLALLGRSVELWRLQPLAAPGLALALLAWQHGAFRRRPFAPMLRRPLPGTA